MAGLLFIMEFRNWTHEEADDAYMFNIDAQDALNLQPENQSLRRRTIEQYIRLFREDKLAQAIMHEVSGELVPKFRHANTVFCVARVFSKQWNDRRLEDVARLTS